MSGRLDVVGTRGGKVTLETTVADTKITPDERARRGIRGWSRQYSPTGKAHRYLLEAIPAQLWISARARAKREGVSMRTLILRLLTEYVEGAGRS